MVAQTCWLFCLFVSILRKCANTLLDFEHTDVVPIAPWVAISLVQIASCGFRRCKQSFLFSVPAAAVFPAGKVVSSEQWTSVLSPR